MLDVRARWEVLKEVHPELNLYALIDGYQFEQHEGRRLERQPGYRALFDGTEDEPLAHAGPWLIDMLQHGELIESLGKLEQATPCLSWIVTHVTLDGLAQMLQLKLDAELPDGKTALLRFYDPRVLVNLFEVMDAEHRAEFFYLIAEWHVLHKGQRVWAGRHDA